MEGLGRQHCNSCTLPLPSLSCLRALARSEGDRLSGLIVDVLGETLVVASSAAWVEQYRVDIIGCLQQETGVVPPSEVQKALAEPVKDLAYAPPSAECVRHQKHENTAGASGVLHPAASSTA